MPSIYSYAELPNSQCRCKGRHGCLQLDNNPVIHSETDWMYVWMYVGISLSPFGGDRCRLLAYSSYSGIVPRPS